MRVRLREARLHHGDRLGRADTRDDILALRGTYPGFGGSATAIAGKRLNSFDDIAGSGASSSFGGIAPASLPGWVGQTIALSAAYSHEAALQFDARITQYSLFN